jgi:8-oxo-dGTP diphosphatase
MNDDLRRAVYLIADEMRGMATLEKHYAKDPYIAEHAQNMMKLAAKLAALVDTAHDEAETLSAFTNPDLWRGSPAMGADAVVYDANGHVLLIRRRGDGTWSLPGGGVAMGETPAQAALKELWEEAGLRGQVRHLLGVYDAQRWGSRSPIHHMIFVFEVTCDDLTPKPGIEATEARFFPPDALPRNNMHPSHIDRVPHVLALKPGDCYFDPADSRGADLPMTHHPPES